MQCFRTYQFCAKSSSPLLLKTLQNLKISKTNSTLLFSVSTNVPDLENVVSYLSNSAAQSIGCLSAPISRCPDRAICSVGYLNAKDCVPFRSTIPGKSPVQVGRWLTRTSSESSRYNDRLPDFSQDVSLWTNPNEPQILPEPLSSLASTRYEGSVSFFLSFLYQVPDVTAQRFEFNRILHGQCSRRFDRSSKPPVRYKTGTYFIH